MPPWIFSISFAQSALYALATVPASVQKQPRLCLRPEDSATALSRGCPRSPAKGGGPSYLSGLLLLALGTMKWPFFPHPFDFQGSSSVCCQTSRTMAGTFNKTEYVPFDFAAANKRFAGHKYPAPDPVVGDRSRTGIVCCSDPRCTPEVFFKLRFQEAFCVRNEGGRTADPSVLRTISLIDALGSTVNEKIEEIMVVHHTGGFPENLLKKVQSMFMFLDADPGQQIAAH